MRSVWLVLSLWSLSLYAYQDADLASITVQAHANAHVYADYFKKMSVSSLRAHKNGQNTPLSHDEAVSIKRTEPIGDHLKKVSQIVVFLSFSMPEKSLEAWLLQCKQSKATPVVRGLIHHSFPETMKAVYRLSQKTGVGVQLDPILFKTFDIEMVPVVVYIKDLPECPSNMNCKPVEYDKVYGDVSLDYALEAMSKEDVNDSERHKIIARLRGGLL